MSPVLQRYLEKVIKDNRTIDARGVMQVNRMIELTMEDVYIHLSVRMGSQDKLGIKGMFGETYLIPTTGWDTIFAKMTASQLHASIAALSTTPPLHVDSKTKVTIPPLEYSGASAPSVETGVSTDGLWARHNAWVLLGDPGAGKTTLLKHFALRNAQDYQTGNGSLPILLPLRLFATEWELHSWTADDAVLNYLGNQGLTELGFELEQEREELLAIFKQALDQGRALLLFDGLDEQRNADMQRKTVTAIESLHRQHPGNRFLISSRIIGYDAAPLGSAFNTATLEPFNDEQMEAFFRQWLYAVERQEDIIDDDSTKRRAKEKADELIQQIKNNSGIRALATNPLLCTIIGLIRRQGATLPQLRAELYKLCIDTFIFNWELQKRRRPDQQGSLNKEQTQAVLEELALHFHEHCPENRASQQTITEIIRDFLVTQEGMTPEDATHKAGQLLSLIRDVSGLLIDRGNNEYGFFHLTFQEYLTARAITRRKRDIDRYLEQYLFKPRWREVILLAAAHQGMKDEETGSEFIEAILRHKHPREEIMHYAFRLAFLCLKEARVELETRNRMHLEWAKLYLGQYELRNSLLQLLRQQGGANRCHSDALQPLINALKDNYPVMRWSAVDALGEFKNPVVVPALLSALKDKDSIVRWSTAAALGQIKDPASIPGLIAAFKDADEMVCWSAAEAVGHIKDPRLVPTLLGKLKDKNSRVRISAVWALLQTEELAVVPAVVPALIAALKDDDSLVRSTAATALGHIKDPSIVPALLDALNDNNGENRGFVIVALGKFKDPAVLPTLLTALKDKDSNVRRGATWALSQTEDPTVAPALFTALKDKNSEVRRSAASALSQIKDPAAVPALLTALKDRFSYIRSNAAEALGGIKNQDAVPELLAALKDKNSDVRKSAASALGELKAPSAVPALQAALRDKSNDVRSSVARALGKIKDPSAVPALLTTLKDEVSSVRRDTALALGEIKDLAAASALLSALRDKNSNVRRSAAIALGEIRDPTTIPALLAAFQDKDGQVSKSAYDAIEKIDLGIELCPD